jgi:hypothetical protein
MFSKSHHKSPPPIRFLHSPQFQTWTKTKVPLTGTRDVPYKIVPQGGGPVGGMHSC